MKPFCSLMVCEMDKSGMEAATPLISFIFVRLETTLCMKSMKCRSNCKFLSFFGVCVFLFCNLRRQTEMYLSKLGRALRKKRCFLSSWSMTYRQISPRVRLIYDRSDRAGKLLDCISFENCNKNNITSEERANTMHFTIIRAINWAKHGWHSLP